ncbi:hypothetical protein M5K25_011364 [Dendrobium thyrsiflorum]|uniref:Uncharacterized protein n=1 Tax=Dendrobium thyrsiflorum TaxID=117978 RepID=A0ABD0V319_DENTH
MQLDPHLTQQCNVQANKSTNEIQLRNFSILGSHLSPHLSSDVGECSIFIIKEILFDFICFLFSLRTITSIGSGTSLALASVYSLNRWLSIFIIFTFIIIGFIINVGVPQHVDNFHVYSSSKGWNLEIWAFGIEKWMLGNLKLEKGFDAIGEHTGAGHNRNIVMPFGGKSPSSEGPEFLVRITTPLMDISLCALKLLYCLVYSLADDILVVTALDWSSYHFHYISDPSGCKGSVLLIDISYLTSNSEFSALQIGPNVVQNCSSPRPFRTKFRQPPGVSPASHRVPFPPRLEKARIGGFPARHGRRKWSFTRLAEGTAPDSLPTTLGKSVHELVFWCAANAENRV